MDERGRNIVPFKRPDLYVSSSAKFVRQKFAEAPDVPPDNAFVERVALAIAFLAAVKGNS